MQCTLPKGLRVTDGKLTEIWRSRAEQCAHVQQSMTGESVVKLSNIFTMATISIIGAARRTEDDAPSHNSTANHPQSIPHMCTWQ